jgi:excisionase family DNA binding protein
MFASVQEKLLSAKQAAEQLGVSKKTLFKWCHEHRLNYVVFPGKKHPGRFKFHQSALDLFVAQHTVKATNNAPIARWKPPKKKAA